SCQARGVCLSAYQPTQSLSRAVPTSQGFSRWPFAFPSLMSVSTPEPVGALERTSSAAGVAITVGNSEASSGHRNERSTGSGLAAKGQGGAAGSSLAEGRVVPAKRGMVSNGSVTFTKRGGGNCKTFPHSSEPLAYTYFARP